MAVSPDPSVSHSSLGMGNIVINKNQPLPEEWTLPAEWNIEKRETYDNWKVDLQCQIMELDKQLNATSSFAPIKGYGVYEARTTDRDEERLRQEREKMRGKMQHGLRRS